MDPAIRTPLRDRASTGWVQSSHAGSSIAGLAARDRHRATALPRGQAGGRCAAHAEDTLAQHREQARHALALAASHTIGEFLLPGWLAAFRHQHPGARAQIDIVNSSGFLAAVRERRAEIGFVEGRDPLDDLVVITVHRDEIVAVVARGHRWSRRRFLRAADLRDEPYLTREPASGTRAVATAALADAGIELTPSLEVASTQSVKRALMSGGFALLSRLAVTTEVHNGSVHAIPMRDLDLTRELHAVRHPTVPRHRRHARVLAVARRARRGAFLT
jgi:DNA-binding transcriptional LysR family regulator